ncbi:type III secretion protein [Pseudomonas agarici]|uniref:Lipoprotein n=1 Tax=Pseudomonas agarici TaxID=46677 RepID=A0A0X1T5D8_PSEAA|nr:type III secretion inner membrane ring lipoprotein SctJ [Pseudomonas agarici]AMB87261.1 type III secretion protein [Pseudomonas agarici]NWB92704.1 type III secretion inner membrane ring lipoprotein SctJ [Pseudomonas agarici]NWC10664.1 type III secretion inner membrane ring lipoprotein SctJ [Pseudomonas agarici]SEL12451.1 type III secretion apparatus lipoprotein, YscJ/HrcJ family [Pseudomonas agarici]
MRFFGPILLLCLTLLAGCSDESKLFGALSEQDANEVIAQLADQHIEAHKQSEKLGVTVIVPSHEINRAVRILDAAGLPRRTRTSLGEIFKKEGVISTPLEERARYIYALSQELESTLSQIDGVVVARVHVVLPERIAPGEPVQPASAAVFIKHTAVLDPDSVRGRIQQMVASSIPGMSQEALNSKKFAIVFVPAVEFEDKQKLVQFGPFLVDSRDQGFWNMALIASLVGALLLVVLIALALRADWRQALLGRLRPGRSGSGGYPARL